jgi:uncharacterized protein YdaU (DUF1376 family)
MAVEKKADTWMPLYVGAYLGATMHLTTEQHGVYLLLLMACWKSGGRVPNTDDALASIARLSKARWKAHKGTILPFFKVADDYITHERVVSERARADEISEARSKSGIGGAASKWGSRDLAEQNRAKRSERLANARRLATHSSAEWQALLAACEYRCVRCGADEVCKDHIKPIYQGGSDGIENLQPLCRSCNAAKGPDASDLRPSNWRELLTKRLANACVTPAQSQSPVPTAEQKPKQGASAPACPEGVTEQVWQDWLSLRRAKRAPVTQTVVSSATAEAAKAGLSLQAFLTVWCRRGSQGLEADWLKPNERAGPQSTPQSKTLSAIHRLEEMKNGLAGARIADGLPEVALLGVGPDPGD